MPVAIGPTVRRRRLGSELRRLREAHSFKLEEAADQLGLAALNALPHRDGQGAHPDRLPDDDVRDVRRR